ncbi:MAG: type II CRISPR RNA-guided endonuclease Cas9 [Magnetococcales bacterium]|nr:type II CRISPR RNA-guided endonuclease Cas9 [Magnetococcales bacterium]
MERILGLDLGTTSLGWAVIDQDAGGEAGRVVAMGVRIFPEGLEEKTHLPRNQTRRLERMARRQRQRRRNRRKNLGKALTKLGLLPDFHDAAGWREVMGVEPYGLRARAVVEPLPPHHLGRALYHLAKLRGFSSSRLVSGEPTAEDKEKKEKEEGKVKQAIETLNKELAGQTLGTFLAGQEQKRRRRLGREMVVEEFERIWAAQAPHHPTILTEANRDEIHRIIFHQRPVFWRVNTLGRCDLEPEAPLCARGSWLGQRFVLLQNLNSLRLAKPEIRELDAEERLVLLEHLSNQGESSFGGLRKALAGLWKAKDHPIKGVVFNFEEGKAKKMPGNRVEAKIREALGEAWATHPHVSMIRDELYPKLEKIHYHRVGGRRMEIRTLLGVAEERNRFVQEAMDPWALTREQAEILGKFEPPPGWLRHSEKAIRRMLPLMEEGRRYDEAKEACYPAGSDGEGERCSLLPAHPRKQPETRNPAVRRALNETRKVVNNLLVVHGPLQRIRIELARELKLSPAQRLEYQKTQKKREGEREEARKELESNGIASPGRDDIEKWLLWKECQEVCPYTGQPIGFDALFGQDRFQVEHMRPLSRSLDNGFGNKTLCDTEENLRKSNRTPWELYHGDTKRWEEIKQRVTKSLPPAKARRFLDETFSEIGSDAWADRQLQDTRYAAREVRDFLARLGLPVETRNGAMVAQLPVETRNGAMTAQLRHFWGLERVLPPSASGRKNRDDHRHHAVDALVVALTSTTAVQALSRLHAREQKARSGAFPLPWAGLREEARAILGQLVVSHRVRRKISGPLHKQTNYGDTGSSAGKKGEYAMFVFRKPLEAVSKAAIDDIRDARVRAIVTQHAERFGGDLKKALKQGYPVIPGRDGKPDREIRKVRLFLKQQKRLMARLGGGRSWADSGENHHMAIYKNAAGKVCHEVVSLLEAARRKSCGEPVVRRDLGEGWRFVFSLGKGEMLASIGQDGSRSFWVVTSVWSDGVIVHVSHTTAGNDVKKNKGNGVDEGVEKDAGVRYKKPEPLLQAGYDKISVDPIGRVRKAHD